MRFVEVRAPPHVPASQRAIHDSPEVQYGGTARATAEGTQAARVETFEQRPVGWTKHTASPNRGREAESDAGRGTPESVVALDRRADVPDDPVRATEDELQTVRCLDRGLELLALFGDLRRKRTEPAVFGFVGKGPLEQRTHRREIVAPHDVDSHAFR